MQGPLSEYPLNLLLSVLETYTGRLMLNAFEGRADVELRLHGGRLHDLTVNGRRIQAPSRVRGILRDLSRDVGGSFVFERMPHVPPGLLNEPIQSLLLEALVELDDLDANAGHLPDPDAPLEIGDENAPLDRTLTAFLGRTRWHLERGASARTLALDLDLDLGEVRLTVARLMAAGAVQIAVEIPEDIEIVEEVEMADALPEGAEPDMTAPDVTDRDVGARP